jgi:hypothetical protein
MMKSRDEIAMQVKKEWDNQNWRWKLWVEAGGFRTEIFCYSSAEEEYFKCVKELVDQAYKMQSL